MNFTINLSGLNSRIQEWSKSEAGKKRIQGHVHGLAGRGSGKTAGGSTYVGEKDFIKSADAMISFVRSAAAAAGLPASVMRNINSLAHTSPYVGRDGRMRIDIYFADGVSGDLSRGSLYEEGYPDGIDNIIALFNNGYDASNHVYGWWDNHTAEGAGIDVSYRTGQLTNSVYTRSLKQRESLEFMQSAIARFNEKYAGKNLTAEIDDQYSVDT